MKLTKTLALLIPCLLLAGPAVAQDKPPLSFESILKEGTTFTAYPKPWPLKNLVKEDTLTVGTTGAAPPRTFVDPATGELTGSYVKLFSKIAEDLGLKIEIVKLEWAGILPGLAANRFDLACDGATWNAERLASPDFLLTAPTSVNATVALVKKGSGITSWDIAEHKKLGGVRGESYLQAAKERLPEAEVVEFPGLPESVMGLQNGQADVVATHLANALNIIATAPNGSDYEVLGPPLEIYAQSLCVNPREADLLVAVNTLLGNYRSDGTLANLVKEFGAPPDEVTGLDKLGY